MKFSNFPLDSGYLILNWEHEVSEEMMSSFMGHLERHKAKIATPTGRPARLSKILNNNVHDINVSKRWQLSISQNMREAKTELLKTLTNKIRRFVKAFNEEYDVVKRLVLISEPMCERQTIHKDAAADDDDFYVAIFTLQDNTELIIADENGYEITKTLQRKQLIIMDSQLYHAGGKNNEEEYNCRLHFRIGRKDDKAHKKSNKIGLTTLRCAYCGAIRPNREALKYHRQFKCVYNENREKNVARRNETRKRKKDDEEGNQWPVRV